MVELKLCKLRSPDFLPVGFLLRSANEGKLQWRKNGGRFSLVEENWKCEEEWKDCLPGLHFLSTLPLELQTVVPSPVPFSTPSTSFSNPPQSITAGNTVTLEGQESAKPCANQLGLTPGPSKHLPVTFTSAVWVPTRPHNLQSSDSCQTMPSLQNPSTNCIELPSKFQRIRLTEPFHQALSFQNLLLPHCCSNFLKLLNFNTSVSSFYSLKLLHLCNQFLIQSVWNIQCGFCFPVSDRLFWKG